MVRNHPDSYHYLNVSQNHCLKIFPATNIFLKKVDYQRALVNLDELTVREIFKENWIKS